MTYFQERKILPALNVLSRSVFIYPLTSPAAVIWESGQFTLDFFFDTNARASVEDTMLDMFLGLVGGATLIVFLTRGEIKGLIKKNKKPQ